MSQSLIRARDKMIEADNKASTTAKGMKTASFKTTVVAATLPNYLSVVEYIDPLRNHIVGSGTANCANTYVGDPVNAVSGNFYLTRRDIAIP